MAVITTFIKDHTPDCIGNGYHAVEGVFKIHPNRESNEPTVATHIPPFEPRDPSIPSFDLTATHWWTDISKSADMEEFKKHWHRLTLSDEARTQEVLKLEDSFIQIRSAKLVKTCESKYDAPLGTVWGIPGDFNLWMPGIALVASYLAEKKRIDNLSEKNSLDGLFVCARLESLTARLEKIIKSHSNHRCALVVGAFRSGMKKGYIGYFEENFPQHKAVVCVEKIGSKLSIALLDAKPEPRANKFILPEAINCNLWDHIELDNHFNEQELVFRAILKALHGLKKPPRLCHSQVLRQMSYGDEVFALQDAMAFLRDPDFFNSITCSDKQVKLPNNFNIDIITVLPLEFMIGTQSAETLETYRKTVPPYMFELPLKGKKKSLQNYFDKYIAKPSEKDSIALYENYYITRKSFSYMHFAFIAFKQLDKKDIKDIIHKRLLP